MRIWPDKFIYVCNATQAAIVNVLPLVHAGIERVRRIVILVGAKGPNETDARARREALDPAQRLKEFTRELIGGRHPIPIDFLYGDPAMFADWIRHIEAICADASQLGIPVIYNFTGGTKPTCIGAIVGGINKTQLVLSAGDPLRTTFMDTTGAHEAERNGGLSLEQFLACYGLHEINPEGRRKQEQLYEAHRAAIDRFAERVFRLAGDPNGVGRFFGELGKLLKPLTAKSGEFVPGALKLNETRAGRIGEELAAALTEFRALPGCTIESPGDHEAMIVHVKKEGAARMLNGGWLEGFLFNRVRALMAGRNDCFVYANVRLAFPPRGPGPKETVAEIDVAVMIQSQLHIIEAKTASFGAKASKAGNEHSLAQIDSIKRQLLAQFGCAFVVNPRETTSSLEGGPGDFVRRSRAAGIELLLGAKSADLLDARLRQLMNR